MLCLFVFLVHVSFVLHVLCLLLSCLSAVVVVVGAILVGVVAFVAGISGTYLPLSVPSEARSLRIRRVVTSLYTK